MNHLSKEQQRALRQQLTERRQHLRSEIREELLRSDSEQYSDLVDGVHDEGEESVADLLKDSSIATMNRLVTELREVEAALQRMDMGSYGVCDDCGTEIPFERLRAYPSARRCLDDQRRYERTYASGERPKL